jgi:type I restriction enzyme R subunit
MNNLNENNLTEQSLIEWLQGQGYEYVYGPDINLGQPRAEREDFRGVVLKDRLLGAIRRINPSLPAEQAEMVVKEIADYHHNDPMLGNKEFYSWLTNGKKTSWRENGEEKTDLVKLVDFNNPDANEFLAVRQFTVQGIDATCRLDVVVFINGLPIGLFELKSAVHGGATIGEAYRQVERYKKEIPKLFLYNQVIGLSDLINARHGTISSSWERYGTWKGITTPTDAPKNTNQLEVLAKGLFDRTRLLDVLQNFFVFEADGDGEAITYTKKMCLYHQYYGVNTTVESTLRAVAGEQDRKIGVFWHTQGSGKSLSMVFYVNKTKNIEELKSPAYLFLTDREDLDDQLSKLFARVGYKDVSHRAESILDLRDQIKQLDNGVSRLIFSTIQKFQDYKEAFSYFSERDNIIVLADEAHRTQYSGLAGNVRKALPQASFLAVTGTPVAKEDGKNTQRVFGDIVSEYKLSEAVRDGATVDIIYEARLVPLGIAKEDLNVLFDELLGDIVVEERAKIQKEWTVLEKVVGTQSRLEQIAKDIVHHFNQRPIEGKGMIVTMSRRIAVSLYQEIQKITDAPECAVVISNNDEYRDVIQRERHVKNLEKSFKNNKDPLRLVIVCDMWLTGFDVPSVHTMYFDKPLKNHGLMQAIARVNRVHKDKPAGLIVDYIGLAENLKKALSMYDGKIDQNSIIQIDDIVQKIRELNAVIKGYFGNLDFDSYKQKNGQALSLLLQEASERVISNNSILSDERKMKYFGLVSLVSKLHASIMPDEKALTFSSDITFYQAIKEYIKKIGYIPGTIFPEESESAIRNLLDQSMKAEGVINLFGDNQNTKQISIFDKKFEAEIKNVKFKNLAIDATRKLLETEIQSRSKNNKARYETMLDLLKKVIERYENNIISSAEVIKQLLEIADEIKKLDEESQSLGLTPEEITFYDTLQTDPDLKKSGIDIKDFVKELTKRIRRDLTIDWTNNETIKARIRQNVRLLLIQKGITEVMQTERLIESIYMETVRVYREYQPS